ncbi:hypothetical protein A2970_01820 [Candidatus Roizmanbacteria bacterium RIFCSPLOWO2_01_FULL_44_13]|uniref:Uncharacterized protein n=1 Tax=Candidatus Roizmanbacteria bacterium RIFCSPLOWO2_01_FULL_44_13 TaxID=1802069 RepID=A0A1F7J9H3_9BACT|nr:MAG: hypothetical protein A2970_01820 [Candidatus Roizmanbacteria bacterium RIFCSPLOWO2_01_FULL_44_13]
MNKKEILLLSIGIFLTVVAWLVADIYHAATEEKIKQRVELTILKKYQVEEKILEELRVRSE